MVSCSQKFECMNTALEQTDLYLTLYSRPQKFAQYVNRSRFRFVTIDQIGAKVFSEQIYSL